MNENKRCILIADDEPKMVRALHDFFKASSFCVLEARDGMEALDIFYENSNVIDIILLDVMMPRRYGLTTLKQIRELVTNKVELLSQANINQAKRRALSQSPVRMFFERDTV